MQLQHVRSYMYVTTEIVPKYNYGQDSDSNSTARNQFAAASYMYM